MDFSDVPITELAAIVAAYLHYKQGRVYVNDSTPITVEFPPGPLSVGDELIHQVAQAEIVGHKVPILAVGDVVKDRLAAFIHWQDRQSLVQAVALLLKRQLKPEPFRGFCLQEGSEDDYNLLVTLYQRGVANHLDSMNNLESVLLTRMLLGDF